MVKDGFVEGCETAFSMNNLEKVDELLSAVRGWRPGELTPYMHAQIDRFAARLDALKGNDPFNGMRASIAAFRELSMPYWTAVASTELAEWLLAEGRGEDTATLVESARATFEQLRATPWLERLDRSGALESLAQAT
jgi:hypothetical protein